MPLGDSLSCSGVSYVCLTASRRLWRKGEGSNLGGSEPGYGLAGRRITSLPPFRDYFLSLIPYCGSCEARETLDRMRMCPSSSPRGENVGTNPSSIMASAMVRTSS